MRSLLLLNLASAFDVAVADADTPSTTSDATSIVVVAYSDSAFVVAVDAGWCVRRLCC